MLLLMSAAIVLFIVILVKTSFYFIKEVFTDFIPGIFTVGGVLAVIAVVLFILII